MKCIVTNQFQVHSLRKLEELTSYGTPTFSIQEVPVETQKKLPKGCGTKWINLSHGGNCAACCPIEAVLEEPCGEWKAFYGEMGKPTGVYYKKTSVDLASQISKLDFSRTEMGEVFQDAPDGAVRYSEHRRNLFLSESQVEGLREPLNTFAKGLPGVKLPDTMTAELLVTLRPTTQQMSDVAQKYHRDFLPSVIEALGSDVYVLFCNSAQITTCKPKKKKMKIPEGPRRIGLMDAAGKEYNLLIPEGVSLAMQGGVIHRGLPVDLANAVLVSYVATDMNGLKVTGLDEVNKILFDNFTHGICK